MPYIGKLLSAATASWTQERTDNSSAACSLLEGPSVDTSTMQLLIRHSLVAVADLAKFSDRTSISAQTVLKEMVTYVSSKFLDISKGSSADGLLKAQRQLIAILHEHPNQVSWAVTSLQVAADSVAAVLPAVLGDAKVKNGKQD